VLQKARGKRVTLDVDWSGKDTRDLRDPQVLGTQQQAKGNGHAIRPTAGH
jgi:hypothetical protein